MTSSPSPLVPESDLTPPSWAVVLVDACGRALAWNPAADSLLRSSAPEHRTSASPSPEQADPTPPSHRPAPPPAPLPPPLAVIPIRGPSHASFPACQLLLFPPPTAAPASADSTPLSPAVNLATARQLTHDFSNVLTSVQASLELACSLPDLSAEAVALLEPTLPVLTRAAKLIDQFRVAIGAPSLAHAHQPPHPWPALHSPETDTDPNAADGNEHILVVDDDPQLRTLVRAVLEYRGYRISEAADGPAALAACRELTPPPDLILTDLTLPGLQGEELLRAYRRALPHPRLLVLSGTVPEGEAGRWVQAPGGAFLSKPFTSEDLARTVRRLLNQPRRAD